MLGLLPRPGGGQDGQTTAPHFPQGRVQGWADDPNQTDETLLEFLLEPVGKQSSLFAGIIKLAESGPGIVSDHLATIKKDLPEKAEERLRQILKPLRETLNTTSLKPLRFGAA